MSRLGGGVGVGGGAAEGSKRARVVSKHAQDFDVKIISQRGSERKESSRPQLFKSRIALSTG